MIGQAALENAARRWGNVQIAMKHYLRKDAGHNTAWGSGAGALFSVGYDAGLNNAHNQNQTYKIARKELALHAGLGAGVTNVLAGGARLLRTAIRNPNSVATQAQMQKWERDLSETPSIKSKFSKLAFWKKN